MLLGQFSVTFKYRLGAQHPNADGLSRQCGQCLRPGYLISSPELHAGDTESSSELLDQRFASSEMGDSMNADLLPELSGEKWVTVTYLEEVTADVPPADSEPDFIVASWLDDHSTPMGSVWIGTPLVGLFGITELRCWWLQFGDLSMDTDGQLWRRRAPPATTSQLVSPPPPRELRELICRYHDSLFAAKKCKLDSPWIGPYLVISLAGWAVGVQLHPDSPILMDGRTDGRTDG